MTMLLGTYLIYVVISIGLTFWVGRTLFVNGRRFLLDIFDQDAQLADSINKLLLIGFYLINLGYVLTNLVIRSTLSSLTDCFEMLSIKIGFIVVVLGLIHFLNIITLFILRSKTTNINTVKAK